MSDKPIIEPERYGLWIAVTFIIALLSLVAASIALKRVWEIAAVTQAEVVMITNKLSELQKAQPAKAPAPTPVAPAPAMPAESK